MDAIRRISQVRKIYIIYKCMFFCSLPILKQFANLIGIPTTFDNVIERYRLGIQFGQAAFVW